MDQSLSGVLVRFIEPLISLIIVLPKILADRHVFAMSSNGVFQFLLLHGFLLVLAAGKSTSRVDREIQHERRNVPFSLEETFDHSLRADSFNGTWKSDRRIMYSDKYTGHIREYDPKTKTSRLLLDYSILSAYDDPTVSFSYDDSYVLIGYGMKHVYRHSAAQKFVVYDTKRRTYTNVANGTSVLLAEWSPTRNALVYVLDNDIYYKTFSNNGGEDRRLTHTGLPGVVYNGVPDWVYEEEVLSAGSALWISPDGRHLAFATYDDTQVKDVTMTHYGKPGSLKDQYPTETTIKYPKVGTPNPIVLLSVVDLTNPSSKLVNLKPPTDIVGRDNILYTVNWWNQNHVVASWTNRVQNKAQWVLYDTEGEASNILYEEEKEGWLRLQPPVYHNQYAVIVKAQNSGAAGKYLHLTRFEYINGKLMNEKDLTPDTSEVHRILGVDHVRERIYFLANGAGKPSQRNLYSVQVDGAGKPVCISCEILTPEGNRCTYATASFSTDKSYYAVSCSGPDPMTVTIFDADHRQVVLWEGNQALRRKLATRAQPIVENLSIKVNGYDAKVRLLLPHDFDEKKTYPLLIHVYAGPNTVRITEAASYGFHSYMTTNRSVIYGFIDGRGSAYKGSKMLFEVYRRLGTVEVEDQIAVAEVLQKTYPWIDASKTAIWGWSYGGFATAMALAIDKNYVFKCGISVAPVSSCIYYDSIYTERYMGLPTPEDNLYGYNQTDVTRRVEGIRGKKFLLIHGTADDNVHYQQALALNKALVAKDIMFEQVSYTDEAHGLIGVSPHFYHTMDRFWDDCFGYSQ